MKSWQRFVHVGRDEIFLFGCWSFTGGARLLLVSAELSEEFLQLQRGQRLSGETGPQPSEPEAQRDATVLRIGDHRDAGSSHAGGDEEASVRRPRWQDQRFLHFWGQPEVAEEEPDLQVGGSPQEAEASGAPG